MTKTTEGKKDEHRDTCAAFYSVKAKCDGGCAPPATERPEAKVCGADMGEVNDWPIRCDREPGHDGNHSHHMSTLTFPMPGYVAPPERPRMTELEAARVLNLHVSTGRGESTAAMVLRELLARLAELSAACEREARLEKTLDAANEIIRIDADLQAKTTERAERAEAEVAALKQQISKSADAYAVHSNELEAEVAALKKELESKEGARMSAVSNYRNAAQALNSLKKERDDLATTVEQLSMSRDSYAEERNHAIARAESAEKDAAELRGRVEKMEAIAFETVRAEVGTGAAAAFAVKLRAAIAPSGTGEKA